MSNLESNFKSITGAVLIFFGMMFTFIGFVGLKGSGEMFFIILLLGIAGLVILISGIGMLIGSRKMKKREDQLVQFIATNPTIPAEPNADNPLVASWHIETGLWKAFRSKEIKTRTIQSYVILGFAAIFMLVIFIPVMGAAWFIALPVAGFLLLMIYIILKARTAQLTKDSPVGMAVNFVASGVVIGADYIPFYNDSRWLHTLTEKQENGLQFLEFKVKWKTSKGAVGSDEVNIPFAETDREQVERAKVYFNTQLSPRME